MRRETLNYDRPQQHIRRFERTVQPLCVVGTNTAEKLGTEQSRAWVVGGAHHLVPHALVIRVLSLAALLESVRAREIIQPHDCQ